ncbi:MAG: hypothetical protein J0M12_07775 [Deltaproteobacteria bacterium]|nr:hypothetical protein [Deltaproteobacteria bacterium]
MSRSRTALSFTSVAVRGLLLCSFVVFLLQGMGCGGGTTGTGGTGSSQFSGRIVSLDGMPISGASVVLEETGDTAISLEDGTFDIESILPGTSATFLVETAEAQASTSIVDIPPGPHDVTIQLKLDEKKNTVTVETKDIAPPKKPRRTPTPKPEPVLTPVVTPTGTAAPITSAVPTGTSTTTPLPDTTISPTATAVQTLTPQITPGITPTSKPALPYLTVFRGVVSGHPQLLKALRIGIVGSATRVKIHSDGSFFFRGEVLAPKATLEVVLGKRSVLLPLDIVTPGTVRVVLSLSASIKSSGGLSITVKSARIID